MPRVFKDEQEKKEYYRLKQQESRARRSKENSINSNVSTKTNNEIGTMTTDFETMTINDIGTMTDFENIGTMTDFNDIGTQTDFNEYNECGIQTDFIEYNECGTMTDFIDLDENNETLIKLKEDLERYKNEIDQLKVYKMNSDMLYIENTKLKELNEYYKSHIQFEKIDIDKIKLLKQIDEYKFENDLNKSIIKENQEIIKELKQSIQINQIKIIPIKLLPNKFNEPTDYQKQKHNEFLEWRKDPTKFKENEVY